MLRAEISKYNSSSAISTKTLFDGCARNLAQAKKLDEEFGIDLAIHVRVPFQEIVKRVSARWIHPGSQRSYNDLVRSFVFIKKTSVSGHHTIVGP